MPKTDSASESASDDDSTPVPPPTNGVKRLSKGKQKIKPEIFVEDSRKRSKARSTKMAHVEKDMKHLFTRTGTTSLVLFSWSNRPGADDQYRIFGTGAFDMSNLKTREDDSGVPHFTNLLEKMKLIKSAFAETTRVPGASLEVSKEAKKPRGRPRKVKLVDEGEKGEEEGEKNIS